MPTSEASIHRHDTRPGRTTRVTLQLHQFWTQKVKLFRRRGKAISWHPSPACLPACPAAVLALLLTITPTSTPTSNLTPTLPSIWSVVRHGQDAQAPPFEDCIQDFLDKPEATRTKKVRARVMPPQLNSPPSLSLRVPGRRPTHPATPPGCSPCARRLCVCGGG